MMPTFSWNSSPLSDTAYLVRSLRQSIQKFHRLPFKDEEVTEKILPHNTKKVFEV